MKYCNVYEVRNVICKIKVWNFPPFNNIYHKLFIHLIEIEFNVLEFEEEILYHQIKPLNLKQQFFSVT